MELLSGPQEVLAAAFGFCIAGCRWTARGFKGFGCGSLYLYALLGGHLRIIGISGFYHDSAAALIDDGRIAAAAQEERFTRVRHDSAFPAESIRFCLDSQALKAEQVDYWVFYDKPFIKFERLLETYLATAPRGYQSFRTSLPVWLKDKLFQKSAIIKELKKLYADPPADLSRKLLFTEHHQAHAASAFFASPFEEAIVLTMDGVGEWTTTSVAVGRGQDLQIEREIHFPHSLGLLYSAFTYYTGFKVNSGEYKVMGLAPYGRPIFKDLIMQQLVRLNHEDGSFQLNMDYFDYCTGLKMTNAKFAQLFGGPPRSPEEKLAQRHMDLAASIQAALEEIVLNLTACLAREFQIPNLCLAGGVALNCVANGKILRQKMFQNIWIQPAAGDAGGAVGAGLAAYHQYLGKPRRVSDRADLMNGSYLGPEFSQTQIEQRLRGAGAQFQVLSDEELMDQTVDALVNEKAVGWFQGRMEFGPRSLGARSIIGDARSKSMQKVLNLKVKFRESFRPFAPAVLSEDAKQWFDLDCESPYMLLVADVAKARQREMSAHEQTLFGIEKLNVVRSEIPAVTHVDYSARVQTVHQETNPRFHRLLQAFKQQTNCPVLVNTSFNVRGEPIVCTPEDAFRCFMGTDIETLVIGNCLLHKSEQDPHLAQDYKNRFDLD